MCTQQFRSFLLPGLLPEHHKLVLNTHHHGQAFILTMIDSQVCDLVAQQVLSELEMYITIALVEALPSYCSYEMLLSAVTDKPLQESRKLVHEALEARVLDAALNPLRNLVKRCRHKLQVFGLDVRSLQGLGYQLVRARQM